MENKKIVLAIFVVLLMVGTAFVVFQNASPISSTNETSNLGLNAETAAQAYSSSSTPWQMPTTTMQEPGYTNGTFQCGLDCTIGDLNTFTANTFGDLFIIKLVYGSLYYQLPNGQIVPWLATGYKLAHVTTNNKTFDIETNSMVNYSYVYTINLRPYVQWTDWSAANASQTYTFSNTTQFYYKGNLTTHTYKSFSTTTMKKYYLQSADVALSWRLEAGMGGWPGVVNVVPNGNLSVKLYVSKPTLLLQTSSLESYILPYHIWVHHDFTSSAKLYNCTPGISSGNGYLGWNLGWNIATGSVPGLVGNGPFMVNNGYGMPNGEINPNHLDKFYVNPHFFAQYANVSSGLRQFTPKIYEFYQPYFASQSSMVAAFTKGQLDMLPVTPTFLSLVKGTPGAYIYTAPSQVFCAVRINENYTPLNITAFRQALSYATPYQTIDGTVYDGLLTVTSNTVPPCNILWYNSSTPQYSYNLVKARQLINSIPGMQNISGVLNYNGKPITIQIQIAPGSETPCDVEVATEISQGWAHLGVKTTIVEEAYTTMFANIYYSVIGKANDYQVAIYGQGTEAADPAILCALFVNDAPAYFAFGCTLGPYTSLTYNGVHLTGKQVTLLLTNLSNELLASDSFSQATKISGEIQTIIAEEATLINIGYTTVMDAFQTNQFANFTTTQSSSLFSVYFTLLEVHKIASSKTISYNYGMKIEQNFTGSLVQTAGNTGSIVYTVLNTTSGLPVQGATIGISVSSIAKGIINVTSNQLTTNAAGQATWKYEVFAGLNQLLQTLKNNKIINLPSEEVNITATVNPPSSEVHTKTTSTYLNIELINTNEKNHLSISAKYTGKSHLYTGNTGSISYSVANTTGSAVHDANITIVMTGMVGSLSSKSYTFNASTGKNGTFSFSVSNALAQIMQTYSSSGAVMPIFYQEVNITAVVTVGGQNQTGAGTTYTNVFLINPALYMTYAVGSTSYTTGQTGTVTFTVTENGSAVSGASVDITSAVLVGLNYSSSAVSMTTNSSGMAVFSFKVGNASSGTTTLQNESLVAKASESSSSVASYTVTVNFTVTEKGKPVPASSSNTYLYVVLGVVAAALVVGAVVLVMRKPKTPKS